MAVTKTEYPVNGGSTGWSKTDVIDALEAAFAGLGWHSGTSRTGVPTTVLAPGSSRPVASDSNALTNFEYATAVLETEYSRYYRYYDVTNDGGSSHYNIKRVQDISYIYYYNDSPFEGYIQLNYSGDIPTGTPMVYREGTTVVPNRNGTTEPIFVNGTTYYIINIPGQSNYVRFADSESEALAGTYIEPANPASGSTLGSFEQDLGDNPTIIVRMGDRLYFNNNSVGHPLFIQDQSGAYDANRTLDTNNFRQVGSRDFPSNQGIEIGTLEWEIDDWSQGDYYYVCQNHSSMNGIIRVLPSTNSNINLTDINNNTYDDLLPYWDYTVPSGGTSGKTDLQLRIRRKTNGSGRGELHSIQIMNDATGWTEDEVFTIPGDDIGGESPANDIVFGVNSLTAQQQTDRTGVCSLKVTDIGAGSDFYQKYSDGAILRLEHDNSKTYGHVFYGFRMSESNDYQMYIGSGVDWKYNNYYPGSNNWEYQGEWGGQPGLDTTDFDLHMDNDVYKYQEHQIATTNGPTSYPLKIVTHQATNPQDTNFVTISFVQTISAIENVFLTFSPLKGTRVGSNIWDLDYVWNGTYLEINDVTYNSNENIKVITHYPWQYRSADEVLGSSRSVRREAFYGYNRDVNNTNLDYYWEDNYSNNIYELQGDNNDQKLGYYRNSNFDYVTVNYQNTTDANINDALVNIPVDSNADYYRPFKGLPMNSNMMPCPYYLPDDFAVIQFAVNPGATTFRFGDTITINDAEIYEIIQVNYTTNQLGLDGISGNTSKGIAFCARTT